MARTCQSWAERMAADPSLRMFVDGEIARAQIDVHVARVETRHWQRIAERQAVELAELRPAAERDRRSNASRQRRWRERQQFIVPVIE